jgi:hypothetical protein
MKTILTLTVILLAGMQNLSAQTQMIEACKTFIVQGKAYQSTLKVSEAQADATLVFYKKNIVANCGNLVAKVQYKMDFFPELMVKDTEATLQRCKTSIKIAKEHQSENAFDKKVFEAHKENIIDNCGTLVAKTTPAFCLFDVVDSSSKEKLKTLCLSAIKEAHRLKSISTDTKAVSVHKSNIVDKCGKLHATL